MICKKCGKELNDGVMFCKYCGEKQINAEEMQKNSEKETIQEEILQIKEKVVSNATTKQVSKLEKALNNLNNRQNKCPHCGMLLINGAKFCKNCGNSV